MINSVKGVRNAIKLNCPLASIGYSDSYIIIEMMNKNLNSEFFIQTRIKAPFNMKHTFNYSSNITHIENGSATSGNE